MPRAAREAIHPYRLLGSFATLLFTLSCSSPTPTDIILVTFDTLRQDRIGAYGSQRGLTPHLDALAERALVYDSAFTTMPTTAPAHMSLFTGLYPFEHGVRYNGDFAEIYGNHVRNLVSRLHERGYATSCFITSPLFGRAGDSLDGFEYCDFPEEKLRSGEDAARAAIDWFDRAREGPVFLWLHLYDPHAPYGSADEKAASFPVDLARYGWIGSSRLPLKRRQQIIQQYERGVRDADRAFGRLTDALGDRLDKILMIAVADHGEYLDERLSIGYAWGHGALLGDEVLRIPLMLAGPGVEPGRSSTAVSIRDLYTTVLEAAGIGDSTASSEGRLDLRAAPSGRRVVSAERRTYSDPELMLSLWGPIVWGHVRENAVAAMDGEELVVVGEIAQEDTLNEAMPDLVATARRHRDENLAVSAARDPIKIDDETKKMLRQLGYLD